MLAIPVFDREKGQILKTFFCELKSAFLFDGKLSVESVYRLFFRILGILRKKENSTFN